MNATHALAGSYLARNRLVGQFLAVVGGSAVLAVSAQIAVPGLLVPTTMQSLAVLGVGAVLGPRLGAATVLLYLAEGAAGLPVFANWTGTLIHLTGPTGGYLVGFVPAAWLVGTLARHGLAKGVLRPFLNFLLGHAVILGLGAAYLATIVGPERAVAAGLVPFLWGSVVKSMLGAAIGQSVTQFGLARGRR